MMIECSAKTSDPHRTKARKFLAPAFSTNNLQKTTLDILYHRVDATISKFLKSSLSNEMIDVKNVCPSFFNYNIFFSLPSC